MHGLRCVEIQRERKRDEKSAGAQCFILRLISAKLVVIFNAIRIQQNHSQKSRKVKFNSQKH